MASKKTVPPSAGAGTTESSSASASASASAPSMINPHNPEFLTKKPWYLANHGNDPYQSGGAGGGLGGGAAAAGADEPTLEHQTKFVRDEELSLQAAERLLADRRLKQKSDVARNRFRVGQWVEALKKNKPPYRICKIVAVRKKRTEFDLEYDDGTVERKVKFDAKKQQQQQQQQQQQRKRSRPRIRVTRAGNRAVEDPAVAAAAGKETYDSKRDQYHGYDKETHNAKVAAKYEKRDALRRKLREEEKEKQSSGGTTAENENGNGGEGGPPPSDSDDDSDLDSDAEGDDDSDNDEFVQRDADAKVVTTRIARQGGVGGAQMKVTARNLRIREDTAKYLRNLDPNSAYYDPKSRSMRDNPNPEQDDTLFAGDNAARISGDAVQLADTQLFAWDAEQKGVAEIHPQANPSQAELLKRQFKSKSADLKQDRQRAVLDKYGGAEYLDGTAGLAAAAAARGKEGDPAPDGTDSAKEAAAAATASADRKIRFGVSTSVEEYSRDGRLLSGQAGASKQQRREALVSKYEEDVFANGHATVWGSYFHKGAFMWGYGDDHSLLKNSYCTGQAGRAANDEANEMRYGTGLAGSAALAQARGMLKAMGGGDNKKTAAAGKGNGAFVSKSRLYGEAEPAVTADLDQDKVREALKRGSSSSNNNEASRDDRKRKYHSMNADPDISAEDMEAYRLQKERSADPMAGLASPAGKGDEGLLDYDKGK